MDARRRDSFGELPPRSSPSPTRAARRPSPQGERVVTAPLLAQRSARKIKRIGRKKFLRLRTEMNAMLAREIAEERGAMTREQQMAMEPLPPGADQLPDHQIDDRSFIGPDPRWPRDKYWLRDD